MAPIRVISSSIEARGGYSRVPGLRVLPLLAVILVLTVACSPRPEYKQVQLAENGMETAADTAIITRAPLRVAVSSVVSPKETFRTYQDLIQYLGERMDRPVQLVQRKTYAEVNDLIRHGGIDLAFVCTLAYVMGQQEFGMEALAAPQVRGEPLYQSYLIVPADSAATSLESLRGKLFAFTDPDSNTGRLVPTYLLWQQGETPEAFFRQVVYTYSHDNSIKAVADKLVDGASVDSLVYDYSVGKDPRLAEHTRVIFRSERYGSPPVVVHPALSSDLKEQLKTLLLGMGDDPQGRRILDGLMVDRFVTPSQASYEPIREMLRAIRGRR